MILDQFLKTFVELTLAYPVQGDLKTEECVGNSAVAVLNSAFQCPPPPVATAEEPWKSQTSLHTAVGKTEILSEERDVPSKSFLSHRPVLGPCLFLTQSLTRVWESSALLSIQATHLGKLVCVKPEMCPRDAHVRGLVSCQALSHSDAHSQGDRCPLLLRLRDS